MLCSRKGKESNNFKINLLSNKGAEGLCTAPSLTCEVNDIILPINLVTYIGRDLINDYQTLERHAPLRK